MNHYIKSMNAILSEKGQVTIPKAMREAMGMTQGTVLSFKEEKGKMIVSKVMTSDPILRWRGKCALPLKLNKVDRYLSQIRDGE